MWQISKENLETKKFKHKEFAGLPVKTIRFQKSDGDNQTRRQSSQHQTNNSDHDANDFCDEFEEQFTDQSSIDRQIKQPHACDRCSYIATHSSSLKRHVEVVHEGVKYTCDHCNDQFSQKYRLQKHIKSVHGETIFFGKNYI